MSLLPLLTAVVLPSDGSTGTNSVLFYGLLILGIVLFFSAFLYGRHRRR